MSFKTGTYIPTQGKCRYTKVAKYRSSYELNFIHLLEDAKSVKHWEFERIWIPYTYLGVKHNYLVDFDIELINSQKVLIEIKPMAFYNRAMLRKDRNWHKWNAALSFCRQRGWTFKVVTEGGIALLRRAWC